MEDCNSQLICRTCLGSLNIPKNLRDEKNKNLLNLLHGILGFEIKDQIFKICKKCEAKLKTISKFKDVCLKSLKSLGNIKCKVEPFCVETVQNSYYDISDKRKKSLCKKSNCIPSEPIENKSLKADPIEAADSSSNDSFMIKNFGCNDNDNAEDLPSSKRGVRLDQFPRKAVLEAMAECRSFFTKTKHSTCLHCSYVGKTARGLSVHMSFVHSILSKTWCYQCNIQTTDLSTHQELIQCAKFYCKFCGKFACPIKRATEHLRFHCSKERSTDVLLKQRGLWLEQFSRVAVQRAIAQHRGHFTSVHNTTCLHCDYVGETGRGLSIHMSTLHRDDARNWCYRCNIQTMDIEEHKNSTKCFLYFCKFCDKYVCLVKHTKTHLESHCHGLGTFEENDHSVAETDSDAEDVQFVNKDLSIKVEHADNIRNDANVTNNNDRDAVTIPLRDSLESNVYPHEAVQKALEEIVRPFYTTRQCPTCEVISLNLRHLQKHVRLQHRDLKSRWCSRCNTLEDNLAEHSKSHECGLFQCVFCNESYDNASEIKEHIIVHSDSRNCKVNAIWFNCKCCPSSFRQEADLADHKCNSSGSRQGRTISRGKLTTNRLKNKTLIAKSKRFFSDRKIKSLTDEKYFLSAVKKFKKCAAKKPKVTQLCSICGRVVRRVDFKHHMKIHNEAMFKCSHCDKQFTHKIYLIEHEKRHTGEKSFLCGVCGKGFVTSSECKRHERIHEGGPQQCPICDVQCNRPERLKLHMKRHTGENQYTCAHCSTSFHIKSLLLKHIKSHSDERPYKCSFCDIYFKHREEVTVHERSHTGIRPYSCTLCPFTSVRSKELTNHMKKHPEDAPQANTPYNCQFCTKKFSTNAMLVSHTRNKHDYEEKL